MNRVVLIGRLTKDPELRFTPGTGKAVASFILAVDRRFSSNGQKEADFIPIVVWNKQAEATANYVTKGKLIGVAGRIQTRSYEAQDGTRRYVTEVVADEVQFLQWGDGPQRSGQYNQDNQQWRDEEITPIDDGDIPF
ncbi:single-stranded DNA-binding protein [Clostridium ganghwense]|uniref:Single-stranded DNA-binding protein n=1 Tax=Clostridium ganghwense TaxID=312089 RepID=A0ABT4CTM2_9CLOT|nr:single-stranded DNA-binding protein [Clostridium ganghwense]MCY6372426.1 single-stranded DNA-binding protein [Clostridium ganghwense]